MDLNITFKELVQKDIIDFAALEGRPMVIETLQGYKITAEVVGIDPNIGITLEVTKKYFTKGCHWAIGTRAYCLNGPLSANHTSDNFKAKFEYILERIIIHGSYKQQDYIDKFDGKVTCGTLACGFV